MSVKDFVTFLSTDPQLADVGRTVKTVDLLNLSKASKAQIMSGGRPRTALVVDGEDCLASRGLMGDNAEASYNSILSDFFMGLLRNICGTYALHSKNSFEDSESLQSENLR